MKKIYILVGIIGKWEDKISCILYCGLDKSKAFNDNVDKEYHTLKVEVWFKEELIEEHIRNDRYDGNWEKTYDKLKEIELELQNLKARKEELEKMEILFKGLKEET